jgi:uncharacterized membrane protein YphA (DoxX/SURF4 family)
MSGKAVLLPLARLLMSSLFVWDGIVQLRNPGGTAQYFASVHVPAPDVAVWISILVICSAAWRCLQVSTPDGPLLCLLLSASALLLACICRPEIRPI